MAKIGFDVKGFPSIELEDSDYPNGLDPNSFDITDPDEWGSVARPLAEEFGDITGALASPYALGVEAASVSNFDYEEFQEDVLELVNQELEVLKENYELSVEHIQKTYSDPRDLDDALDSLKEAFERDAAFLTAMYSAVLTGAFHKSELDNGLDSIQDLINDLCFAQGTLVHGANGTLVPIENIRLGDIVQAFDPNAEGGRGALVPRRVTQLHRNCTTEWIKLTWSEGEEVRELLTTPGHRFLDEFGRFREIDQMIRHGRATVVLSSGSLQEVSADRICFSPSTVHMFELPSRLSSDSSGLDKAPLELESWLTYNLEVEDLHTYVAGGVRVHNDSGFGSSGISHEPPSTDSHGPFVIPGTSGQRIPGLDGIGTWGDHEKPDNSTGGGTGSTNGAGGTNSTGGSATSNGAHERPDNSTGGSGSATSGGGVGNSGNNSTSGGTNLGGQMADQRREPGGTGGSGTTSGGTNNGGQLADQRREPGGSTTNSPGTVSSPNNQTSNRPSTALTSPILLDLDGNGVKITEYQNSTQFMTGKDGLQHRSSWAGAGDGVLFYDAGDDNQITEKREYVFTEWNPTAKGDMEAIRSVWDTNGDGKLTSADAEFAKFKVMVTNADGSTTVKTLAELGITEIDLTANATRVELPDGSMITGQTTFTRANGTMGTVANTTLVSDAAGYRVEETVGTDGVNRVVTQTAYAADGGMRLAA